MGEIVTVTKSERVKFCQVIVWDFDGTIKESIDVKTQAFVQLFDAYGSLIAERVQLHHEANGGMSRFDKLPLYLGWAGEEPTKDRVNEFGDRFSQLAMQGVIHAPWVPGVESYLRDNPHNQLFVLVTATPQGEMEEILSALNLSSHFAAVYGAPTDKKEAIAATLAAFDLSPQDCLMIGDARADWAAASANQVPFLLRRHRTNYDVFKDYSGHSIVDFTEL
jgi:phosphoglycolate phosphatase-like HAD superfamily hydrolase